MITGQGSTEMAIEAMKQGAADYIEKPLNADRLNKLKVQIPKLLQQFAVQEQNQQLSAKLEGLTHYGELTGQSEAMRLVYQIIDEIAEMSPDVQVKLLRALETRQVRRLGGKKEIDVDIRVVSATNRNLEEALAESEMREDLYYRLAVVELALPPLRERTDDVQLLAGEFLERFANENGKKITDFAEDARQW